MHLQNSSTGKSESVNNFRQNAYVKVYGTVRVFKEEKAIVGTFIKTVDQFDAITNHLLTVFVSSEARKKGVLTSSDL